MDQPIFSVIIPTYNRRRVLERAVESVLNQTFADFELLIIDDGSSDDTETYVKSISDKRVTYRKKKNGGQNSALNLGMHISSGRYIALLDSDDYWLSDKLEKVYKAYIDDEDVGVVYNWTGYNKGEKVEIEREDKIEGWCYTDVLKVGYLTSPTFLTFKREAIDIIGDLDERISWCQDDDLCFSLCKNYKVKVIREVLGVYSKDDDIQMSKKYPSKRYLDSELFFLRKWEDEVVDNCGKEVMIKRYFKCMCGYVIINDFECADEIYYHVKQM